MKLETWTKRSTPRARAACEQVLEPADVDAVELRGGREDLHQRGGVDHGVAAGHRPLDARPVGDVAHRHRRRREDPRAGRWAAGGGAARGARRARRRSAGRGTRCRPSTGPASGASFSRDRGLRPRARRARRPPSCRGTQPRRANRSARPQRRGMSIGRSSAGSCSTRTVRPEIASSRSSSIPDRAAPGRRRRCRSSPARRRSSEQRGSLRRASATCTKSRRAARLPTRSTGSCSPRAMAASCAAKLGNAKVGACPLPIRLKQRVTTAPAATARRSAAALVSA